MLFSIRRLPLKLSEASQDHRGLLTEAISQQWMEIERQKTSASWPCRWAGFTQLPEALLLLNAPVLASVPSPSHCLTPLTELPGLITPPQIFVSRSASGAVLSETRICQKYLLWLLSQESGCMSSCCPLPAQASQGGLLKGMPISSVSPFLPPFLRMPSLRVLLLAFQSAFPIPWKGSS